MPPACSSKQLDIAADLYIHQTAAVILFARKHRDVVELTQFLYQHATGGGKEIDLARAIVEKIFGHDLHTLLAQIIHDEARIALAHAGAAQVGQHAAAAEDLGLHVLAVRAVPDELVDQHFHREAAVARGAARRACVARGIGQQEMVHAAHAVARIADASGYARPQHRDQHNVTVGHEVL